MVPVSDLTDETVTDCGDYSLRIEFDERIMQ